MTKRIFFILLLAFSPGILLLAQPLNRSTPDAMLKSAKEAESTGNPYAALEYYEDAFDETKDKAINVKIAQLNFELRDYQQAERLLSRIVLRDRKSEYTDLKYWYAMALKHNGKYANAADMFTQYISEEQEDKALVEASKREAAGCIGMKAKQPENLLVNNIGKKATLRKRRRLPLSAAVNCITLLWPLKKSLRWMEKKEIGIPKFIPQPKRVSRRLNLPRPLPWVHKSTAKAGTRAMSVSHRQKQVLLLTRVQMENNYVSESKIYYAGKGSDGWGAAKEVTGVNGDYIAKHPCEGELFGEKVLFFSANIWGQRQL